MRTIEDCLRDAAVAADAEPFLDEATGLASSFFDWSQLLRALCEPPHPTRLRPCADRTLASAVEERQIWGFRDVARVRAAHLEDPAGAADALATAERVFTDQAGAGYLWALLAEGWVESLADVERARGVLERGLAFVREAGSVDGLCAIAERVYRFGDPTRALALAEEAETLDQDGENAWTVANTWRELGDEGRGEQVLAAALDRVVDTDDALQVAKAFGSHDNRDGVIRSLAKAESLASEVGDWLSLAEDAAALEAEPALVRRALERAEAAASEEVDKHRVATGYHLWLGDDVAADRVGPRGLRPEAHRVTVRAVPGWTGSAAGLFDWARSRVTPEGLARVASADYGIDQERNLAALFDLCGTGLVPRRLPWHPGEVLQLYRWHTGGDTDHLARLLCCTILLIADPDDSADSTGPVLVESALALGDEASAHAETFLAWLAEADLPDRVEPDAGADPIPLALLAVLAIRRDPNDVRLDGLLAAFDHQSRATPQALATVRAESLRSTLWDRLVASFVTPVADQPRVRPLIRWLPQVS